MFSAMAASRRLKQISVAASVLRKISPVASVSRQVSAAAYHSCSRPATLRWFSTSMFPPPGAIRVPINQISHLSDGQMQKDSYLSGIKFMRSAELFQKLNENPLLKGKVPDSLVKLKAFRTLVTSGMGIAYESHKLGISVAISFFEDNIEVSTTLEEIRLKEAWGYRLDPSLGITLDSTYVALAEALDSMVDQIYPDIIYPRCFDAFWCRMKGLDKSAPPLNEETEMQLIHNVSLFSTDDYIRFMTEMETLFRWELPLFRKNASVDALFKDVLSDVANLEGYDGLHWLQSIDKHKFLQVSYDFSEQARESKEQPIHDAEERKNFCIKKGVTARRATGALAMAIKGAGLVISVKNMQLLAFRQISLHRVVVFHLYQEILKAPEVKASFPYSVQDMGDAVRAVLPLTAVAIQNGLFKHGCFMESGMTKYRSVSPFSLRSLGLQLERIQRLRWINYTGAGGEETSGSDHCILLPTIDELDAWLEDKEV